MKTEFWTQQRLSLGLVLLAAALWGTTGVFVQSLYNLSETNPLSIGFFRLAFSVPVLWLAGGLAIGRRMLQVQRQDLGLMLAIGLLMALYQVCYFGAIAQIGVAAATLVAICTAPVWVAVLARLLLGEVLTRRVITAGGCAIAGTILLIGMNGAAIGNPAIGLLLGLAAAVGYAAIVLLSRRLANRYHPIQTVAISFTAGALVLLPCSLLAGWVANYAPIGWGYLVYLGVVPTAIGYALYFRGMRHTPATVASIATLLEPLTSTLLAWALLGEQLGPLGLLGAVLLLSAIGLLCRGQ